MLIRLIIIAGVFFVYQSTAAQCDSVQSENASKQPNKVVDKKRFQYYAYIMTDSCKNENRIYRDIINGNISYFPMHFLSKRNVLDIEEFLSQSIRRVKLTNTNISVKELYNFYRQYNAYDTDTNTVIIRIIFFSHKFALSNKYVERTTIPTIIFGSNINCRFYTCTIESDLDLSHFRLKSFYMY